MASDNLSYSRTSNVVKTLCEPCISTGKENAAVSYCLDCDEKFCDICGNNHTTYKASKNHRLCKLAKALPSDAVHLMRELTACASHPSEEVIFICIDEDQPCCNKCAVTKHRKCRQLETIEQCLNYDAVRDDQRNTRPSISWYGGVKILVRSKNHASREHMDVANARISEKGNQLEKQLEALVKDEAQHMVFVAESHDNLKEYLQEVRSKIDSAFNQLHTQLPAQYNAQAQALNQRIQQQQTTADSLRDKIQEYQEKLRYVKKHGQEKHMFLLCREIDQAMKSVEEDVRTLENNKTTSTIDVREYISIDTIANNIIKSLIVKKNKPDNRRKVENRESVKVRKLTGEQPENNMSDDCDCWYYCE
ncbi:uncharacterized protein LOC127857127 [Dreissena polymorpha]|uniref:B box-type domain-containing protein n=1 Tax=Dreissena polymorpha TaxID=45954 RepID=A0A9D3YSC4_DREPO|nr:uncharacterized protein LOC127857127 [Dreissena polymorpha]KAH3706440.1 hypothetical protein DPMN_065826 [Dreissena polymorpha]